MSERSFSQDRPLVVAHRGASATETENTLAAFEAAVVAGADAVEFDVRLSADRVPVVMHDPGVERTTGGHGLVRDLSAAELGKLVIATHAGGEPVPTLLTVLLALSGRIGIDIELKQLPGEPDFDPEGHGLVEATLDALDRSSFVGPVLVSSFDPLAIGAVRQRAAGLPTGLLSTVDADVALDFARREGHGWVLPPVGRVLAAGEGFPSRVHDAGLRVAAWNTDEPAQALALMRAGVDAVATNDPAAIVAAREAG